MLRHANTDAYLDHAVEPTGAGPESRLSQTFDLTFDPSVFDMFVAWSTGAALVVPTRDELMDPAGFVARHGMTHWFSVPSVVSLAARLRRLTPDSSGRPGASPRPLRAPAWRTSTAPPS